MNKLTTVQVSTVHCEQHLIWITTELPNTNWTTDYYTTIEYSELWSSEDVKYKNKTID